MVNTLVRITVTNFDEWQRVFEEAADLRAAYGSRGVTVYRNIDRPDEAILLADYEDLDRARQLFQSPEFREAISKAGVIGRPEVTFLRSIEDLAA